MNCQAASQGAVRCFHSLPRARLQMARATALWCRLSTLKATAAGASAPVVSRSARSHPFPAPYLMFPLSTSEQRLMSPTREPAALNAASVDSPCDPIVRSNLA